MVTKAWKNMAFGTVNAYVILVNNTYPPTDEEWRAWLQVQVARRRLFTRYLVVTQGGSPTTAQQKALYEATAHIAQTNASPVPTAIVSPSTFVDGIVAAMSLIHPVYKAFSPDNMKAAYEYLGIPPAYFGEVEAMIADLKAQLRQ